MRFKVGWRCVVFGFKYGTQEKIIGKLFSSPLIFSNDFGQNSIVGGRKGWGDDWIMMSTFRLV